MIKILFICHGNICRSPMAEYIMKDLVKKRGIAENFEIASAATSTEEIGNPVYPPAKAVLRSHGIRCEGHHARQVTRADYGHFDYLIVMDRYNVRNLNRIIENDELGKVKKMRDFSDHGGDIDDPWYTGAFDEVYEQILAGCEGFLADIQKTGQV